MHTQHTHAGAYAGGGGGGVESMVLGGQTPPLWLYFLFACLLVIDVGHVRGYPYPVCGNLTQFFFFSGRKKMCLLIVHN